MSLSRRRASVLAGVIFSIAAVGCDQSGPPAPSPSGTGGRTNGSGGAGSGGSMSGSGGSAGTGGAGGMQAPGGGGGSGGAVSTLPDAGTSDGQTMPDAARDTGGGGGDTSSPPDASTAMPNPAVLSIMKRVADWQIPRMGTAKGWVHGAGWTGLMATYTATGEAKYLDAVKRWAGNWMVITSGEGRADRQCAAQVFYDAYLAEPTPENAIRYMASKGDLDAVVNGNLRGRVEWWWQDALFMAPPGIARLGKITGDKKYFAEMNRMWWDTYAFLWNPQVGLMYRDNNNRQRFWSRGNGWVFAGIARVLQYLPLDDPKRPDFIKMLNDMATALLKVQAPTGFWRSDLLGPASQGPESSGTGFYTFGLAYGINNGHLDRATYLPAVKKGWMALTSVVNAEGRLGYVQNIGLAPGPAGENESHEFGVGAFLLAGSEVAKIGSLDQ
ncbi:MAG TPA: glycoside hydrolase family 88 protein [Polyangia bacterium]